jgi:hypothetical protein
LTIGTSAPGKSVVQANREESCLSAAFTAAVEWRIVSQNPCRDVPKIEEPARDRYVTDTESTDSESGFRTNWHRLMQKALAAGAIAQAFTFHDLHAKSASDESDLSTGSTRPASTGAHSSSTRF